MTYLQGVFELGTDGPSLIIAAIDGSETSLRAAAYAAGLARRQGSKLALLFVHSVGSFARSAPGAVPAMAEANRQTAAELQARPSSNSPIGWASTPTSSSVKAAPSTS